MNWWRRLLCRERLEDDLDAELRFHFDQLVSDFMREGLSEGDARRQATREFGHVAEIKDDCRRTRGTEWLVDLFSDARIALRMLRKERGFSIVAIGALSLGLGVAAVFFSLVYASCLAPLPFRGAGRLLDVSLRDDSGRRPALTLPQARTIAETAPVQGVGYFTRRVLPVRVRDSSAQQVTVAYVSDEALPLVGEEPAVGRGFRPEEYRQTRGAPALVSARLARDVFGEADAALGRELLVDTVPTMIVGVQTDPVFPDRTDVWQPLSSLPLSSDEPALSLFTAPSPGGPGTSDVSSLIESALRRRSLLTSGRVHITLAPLESRYQADITNPAWIAFIVAGALVVLIASSNVTNLLLSRGVRRTHEIATRLSLGATRGRIFRQLLAETAVLSAAACGGGAFVAWIALRGLRAEMPSTAYVWTPIALDWHVVAVLFAVGAATVLLCGIAPAVQLVKTPATPWQARTTTPGRSVERWGAAFLTVQLALSMLLLCEMGLTVQLYRALSTPRAPAHLDDVLTANLSLSQRKYPMPAKRLAFYAELRTRLLSAGSITHASFEETLPGTERVPRRVVAGSIREPGALVASMTVESGFFDTVGVSMESGRTFRTGSSDADGAVIVNDRFASLFFGTTAVAGRQIRLVPAADDTKSASAVRTIIGVVPSFSDQAVLNPPPIIFLPRDLGRATASTLIVRGATPPQALASVVTDTIAGMDRDVAVDKVIPFTEATWQARWLNRVSQIIITGIASIGFFLAMIGVAAVTAHRAACRARELSVRVALGATPADVVRAVLRPLSLQLAGSLLAGGLLTVLWQGGFGSPGATIANMILAAALVTAAAAFFSVWPAARAAHADPVAALNSQA